MKGNVILGESHVREMEDSSSFAEGKYYRAQMPFILVRKVDRYIEESSLCRIGQVLC